eukprot:CAMPEP_0202897762 /NCGR_PEP_ID=MMETSP1392-20130828/6448_1 /ASSEMBLY_ACC=CAM_ASM_000868 /TAXON_ID=225041 /ORGANISM="Chlamydomonas chlamydogama, Strain SAG 11-48b" /LENGTH=75 /DNA_ID=CAMNT_0049583501 /DNA_START=312 /DNA_END=539 /DNA_ORIENTATION=-
MHFGACYSIQLHGTDSTSLHDGIHMGSPARLHPITGHVTTFSHRGEENIIIVPLDNPVVETQSKFHPINSNGTPA